MLRVSQGEKIESSPFSNTSYLACDLINLKKVSESIDDSIFASEEHTNSQKTETFGKYQLLYQNFCIVNMGF